MLNKAVLEIELHNDGQDKAGPGPSTLRSWRRSREILMEYMGKAGIVGAFHMYPKRKTRWRIQAKVPVKLKFCDRFSLVAAVKPGVEEGAAVWEFRLVCPNHVTGAEVHGIFQRYLLKLLAPDEDLPELPDLEEELPEEEAVVEETVEPEAPAAGNGQANGKPHPLPATDDIPTPERFLGLLNRLNTDAERERQRRLRIAELQARRQEIERQIGELHAQLKDLEDEEIKVLEEADTDQDARTAIESLRALEKLLTVRNEPHEQKEAARA